MTESEAAFESFAAVVVIIVVVVIVVRHTLPVPKFTAMDDRAVSTLISALILAKLQKALDLLSRSSCLMHLLLKRQTQNLGFLSFTKLQKVLALWPRSAGIDDESVSGGSIS